MKNRHPHVPTSHAGLSAKDRSRRQRRAPAVAAALVLAAATTALWTTACGRQAEPVRIVAALPLESFTFGRSLQQATELAMADAGHRAGKVPVELVVLDTSVAGDPRSLAGEKAAVERALGDPAVVAYLGSPATSFTRFSLPLLNQAGVTQISPTATWPGLTRPGFAPGEPGIFYPTGRRHFFRLIPPDDVQGSVAAHWAADRSWRRVFLVTDTTSYSEGLCGIFESVASDLGVETVGRESVGAGPPVETAAGTGETMVARIRRTTPSLIFVCGGGQPGGMNLLRTLRQQLPETPVLTTDGFAPREVTARLGEDLARGIYTLQPELYAPSTPPPALEAFQQRFEDRYGREASNEDARTYEAVRVLLLAIERAAAYDDTTSPDRARVLTAMHQLGEVSGILGRWRFDAHGDISLSDARILPPVRNLPALVELEAQAGRAGDAL